MKIHHILILTVCLMLVLSACNTAPRPLSPPLPEVTQTPTQSSTPSPSPTVTLTTTPQDTPTPLPNQRQTPLTLMLHRPNANFDTLTFLKDFIVILQKEDIQVLTYRDLSKNPDMSATQQGKLFIITIDDIYLRYPIAPDVLQMIDLLKEAGYPAVLGVITENDYTDPETVVTLKELSGLGWEIATHTDTHRNLLDVQQISPKAIYPEIKTSLDKLENALGLRPITLVLPLGQMTYGDEQIKRAEVGWVVGINGGQSYKLSAAYFYVGREGPAGSAQETFAIMKQRFNP
jgi:peptidoglycan/xylan/chitin deacetylase (PgdA/CDA1 family)